MKGRSWKWENHREARYIRSPHTCGQWRNYNHKEGAHERAQQREKAKQTWELAELWTLPNSSQSTNKWIDRGWKIYKFKVLKYNLCPNPWLTTELRRHRVNAWPGEKIKMRGEKSLRFCAETAVATHRWEVTVHNLSQANHLKYTYIHTPIPLKKYNTSELLKYIIKMSRLFKKLQYL